MRICEQSKNFSQNFASEGLTCASQCKRVPRQYRNDQSCCAHQPSNCTKHKRQNKLPNSLLLLKKKRQPLLSCNNNAIIFLVFITDWWNEMGTSLFVSAKITQENSSFYDGTVFCMLKSSPQTCDQQCPVRVRKWRRDLWPYLFSDCFMNSTSALPLYSLDVLGMFVCLFVNL